VRIDVAAVSSGPLVTATEEGDVVVAGSVARSPAEAVADADVDADVDA
jgi:hypothetical protein